VMLGFAEGDDLPATTDDSFDAAVVKDSPLAWLFRGSAERGSAWVAHFSHTWSARHLEDEQADVTRACVEALTACTGRPLDPVHAVAHRWRYVAAKHPPGKACLTGDGLVACGDWCLGDTVECAWLSGRAAARHILGQH
ncbi:MAG: NAD/FAD-dependent oxidoreductase, partial [Planctomycetota bacterium]